MYLNLILLTRLLKVYLIKIQLAVNKNDENTSNIQSNLISLIKAEIDKSMQIHTNLLI